MIVDRLRQRLADRPHAHLAAAVITARGHTLLDQQQFADLLRVPVSHVRSWEDGTRPAVHVPRRIRATVPELDWEAAGVHPAGDPADAASRHPSAHRSVG